MRRLRLVLICLLCGASNFLFGQFTDFFSDGNFTANPAWSGDAGEWEVLSGRLHLIGPAVANYTSHLSTPSTAIHNGTWEFTVDLVGTTAGGSFAEVFLTSDQPNVEGAVTGYFVRIGDTPDEISLFYSNAGANTMIINGTNGRTSDVNPHVRVRVTRSPVGLWTLESDTTNAGGNYFTEGSVTHTTSTSSAYFGVLTTYATAARNTWCYVDSIIVTGTVLPDTTKPTVVSVVPNSATNVTVTFSEKVSLATAQSTTNYLFNNTWNPSSATIVPGDTTKVTLVLSPNQLANCGSDSVRIANVQDRATNVMLPDTLSSTYFVPGTAIWKSVVFTEIYADNSPAAACIPNVEYLEIFNRSAFPVDLQNWKYNNGGTKTITTVSYPLCPGEYAILTGNAAAFVGYSNVIQVPSFGTLTNTSDEIGLRSAAGVSIDSVEYRDTWYQDPNKAGGGFSLELINTTDTCATASNWIATNDGCGGTPGAQNSVNNPAPDLTPPVITSITVTGPNTLTVCFSEGTTLASSSVPTNFLANNGLGNPTNAAPIAPDFACVNLTFATNITPSILYTLTATNITDCHGNTQPSSGQFLSSGPAVRKDVIINEVYFDPDTSSNLPLVEYVELYNRSTSAFSLGGWKFSDSGSPNTLAGYILLPGAYVILCDEADTAAFNGLPYLGMPVFPALNNTGDDLGLRDNYGNRVDTVSYDLSYYNDPSKENGGWSIELKNPNDTCGTVTNWAASVDPDGGTPGAINSVFTTAPDLTAPSIVSVAVLGPNTLQVCFDEALDPATAVATGNYSADNALNGPSGVSLVGPGNECVILTFAGSIVPGIIYNLTATGVEDCPGNSATTTGQFLLSPTAAWRSLVFNEVFPDPDTAATNMPNAEYLEIYNRSATPFDIGGWRYSDRTSTVTLPNHILLPGEYVLLCDDNDTAKFTGLPYLGLQTWPSLNNTDDDLALHNPLGTLIDTLPYTLAYYHDPSKDDGGWSMELVNPGDTCNALNNWRASVDPDGGTPGEINSVYSTAPDTIAPNIISITVTGANSVQVCFDEGIDQATGSMPGNYTVNNGLGPVTSATLLPNGNTCVDLVFANAIDTGTVYLLTATGVEDCSGNDAPTGGSFVLSGPANYRDILINEVFADPDPGATSLPDVEYVELYNRSSQAYDLGGWTFHNSGRRVLGQHVLYPGGYVILVKESDTAAYTGIPYLGIASWPTLTNTSDRLGLHDPSGTRIDTVEYNDGMYQDPTKDDGGWSLELINPTDSCALIGNWRASNDSTGGTPGRQNSLYDPTPDQTAPVLLSATAIDATHVQVCFDETMDLSRLLNETNYSVDNLIGQPISATLVPGSGNACAELLLPVAIDTGTIYTVTVSNMADCKGNTAGPLTGQFVLGGSAQPFQVVINEIYPDESPVILDMPDGEFLELYNNGTNVVSLSGWTITDRRDIGTLPAYNIFPGGHVILCSSGNQSAYAAFGPTLAVSGMPGLNNDGDSLEIYDASGRLMDFAYYNLGWYHDPAKEDGGWTMERVDPLFPCMNGDNWRASVAARGGTPGDTNSVIATFSDSEAPTMLSALVTSRSTIRLFFNEQMDPSSLLPTANYVVDNGIGAATQVLVNGSFPYSVDLTFGNLMDTNLVYCISVQGVSDCPGNLIVTPNSLCFGIAAPMEAGDLIINEILYNPYTGGSDFVEFYNTSDKILDISELNIAEIFPGTDSIFNSKPCSEVPRLLLPHSYVAITADRQNQIDTYLPIDPNAIYEIGSIPSYDDDEGECVIYTNGGIIMDRLHYYDDWAFPNLDDKNGVSLERLDFNRPTQDQHNWHSAASTVRYATPGYKNSEQLVPEGDDELWLQPETFSPDQDGFEDVISINYHFTTPGWNVRVSVLDNKGRFVRRLVENTLIGTDQGTFVWDGTTDGFHKADIGVYVILFEANNPTSGDRRTLKRGCVLAAKLD